MALRRPRPRPPDSVEERAQRQGPHRVKPRHFHPAALEPRQLPRPSALYDARAERVGSPASPCKGGCRGPEEDGAQLAGRKEFPKGRGGGGAGWGRRTGCVCKESPKGRGGEGEACVRSLRRGGAGEVLAGGGGRGVCVCKESLKGRGGGCKESPKGRRRGSPCKLQGSGRSSPGCRGGGL
ncbi:unnamed protein product [Lepidochelys kempii]